jgi:hypothetical protein
MEKLEIPVIHSGFRNGSSLIQQKKNVYQLKQKYSEQPQKWYSYVI